MKVTIDDLGKSFDGRPAMLEARMSLNWAFKVKIGDVVVTSDNRKFLIVKNRQILSLGSGFKFGLDYLLDREYEIFEHECKTCKKIKDINESNDGKVELDVDINIYSFDEDGEQHGYKSIQKEGMNYCPEYGREMIV